MNGGKSMGNYYGYHRTSTTDQHLDRGLKEIEDYCKSSGIKLEKIYTDQQTGKNFNRPRYQVMKEDVLRIILMLYKLKVLTHLKLKLLKVRLMSLLVKLKICQQKQKQKLVLKQMIVLRI